MLLLNVFSHFEAGVLVLVPPLRQTWPSPFPVLALKVSINDWMFEILDSITIDGKTVSRVIPKVLSLDFDGHFQDGDFFRLEIPLCHLCNFLNWNQEW